MQSEASTGGIRVIFFFTIFRPGFYHGALSSPLFPSPLFSGCDDRGYLPGQWGRRRSLWHQARTQASSCRQHGANVSPRLASERKLCQTGANYRSCSVVLERVPRHKMPGGGSDTSVGSLLKL